VRNHSQEIAQHHRSRPSGDGREALSESCERRYSSCVRRLWLAQSRASRTDIGTSKTGEAESSALAALGCAARAVRLCTGQLIDVALSSQRADGRLAVRGVLL